MSSALLTREPARTPAPTPTTDFENPARAFESVVLENTAGRANHDFRDVPATLPGSEPMLEPAADDPGPQDGSVKVEAGSTIAGLALGAGVGGLIGGLAGGPLGILVGGLIGGLVGAIVGGIAGSGSDQDLGPPPPAPGAAAGGGAAGISWDTAAYSAVGAGGASTTVERPFVPTYKANDNAAKNVWEMQVGQMKGGATIEVHLGGSRNPITSPPTSEAEAQSAVTDMKGYYARGSRGSWHTEAASKAHEEHHVREWHGSADHYWPTAKAAIEKLTLPKASAANEGDAVTQMRAGASGADAIAQKFHDISRKYWFTLSDGPSSRPFAAGQSVLNNAITSVQTLAAGKGWSVAAGTNSPSAEPPCYQPWLPFAP